MDRTGDQRWERRLDLAVGTAVARSCREPGRRRRARCGAARGEGAEGAPADAGQGGEGERGAQPRPDQGTGGVESVATQGGPGSASGDPSLTATGGVEAFLETPRGREVFQDFLAQLARQPAPSEMPAQGGTTATPAQGVSGTAVSMTASTARPSLPTTMNPAQPLVMTGGSGPSAVPMATPMYSAPSVPGQPGGYVPASILGSPWQGPMRTMGVMPTGPMSWVGPTAPVLGIGATAVPAGDAMGNVGTAPVQTTETSTMGSGTKGAGATTSNPALQTFLMDALSQALRLYATNRGSSTVVQPLPAVASVTRPMGYSSQTPVYTPSGISRAAIPSYGGVAINDPSVAGGNAGMGALPPGAFYPPFQPALVTTPAWGTAVGTTYPQVPYRGQPLAGLSQSQGASQFDGHGGRYGMPAAANYQPRNYPVVGIPNELRNAVKVIIPFHSEAASSERAAAFWRSFERCTCGMDGQMRLTAFEQCLKGKVGLEWWYNSRIDSFETLRVRFHNRFICQTPAQLWNRLKNAKRNKGESAEEWGDRILTMCEALNYNEPRMQFEFFLDGLRNEQMRTMLNSSMVTSIPEACALLLYKNLHLPGEEEDDLVGDGTGRTETKDASSTQSQMLQQLQLINQMMMLQQSAGTPHSGQINAVAPALAAVPFSSGNAGTQPGPLQIRLAPDTRTTEGGVVCGRCVRAGHGRELCPRRNGQCYRCGEQGHHSMECNGLRAAGNFSNGERRGMACLLCSDENHSMLKCPGLEQLRGLVTAAASGTAAPTTQS